MGRKPLDLENKKFGELTVINRVYKEASQNDSYWLCKCSCGKECTVTGSNLKSGQTISCGCINDINRRSNFKDLTGTKFGRLTVISKTDKRKSRKIVWNCLCDCGKTIEAEQSKLGKQIMSCGCLKTEELLKDCVEHTRLRNLTSKKRKRINKDSGVKGVIWDKERNKWKACIGIKGKNIQLGRFGTIEEAEKARKEAEEKYFKPVLEKYSSKDGE